MTTATTPETTPAAPDADNGHVTKSDLYRRDVSRELALARRDLREASQRLQDAKADVTDAKELKAGAQARVNELSAELEDIEAGRYTPRMFGGGPAEAPAPIDGEWTTSDTSIEVLAEYGLTEKQCELLLTSELEIKTIGKLEQVMREDEWWHRKIKGIGKERIDKISDALFSWRKEHPVPVAAEPESTERQEASPESETEGAK